MLTEELMSMKWQIRLSLSNNKIDQYVIAVPELMRYINRQRRIQRKLIRKTGSKAITRPAQPLNTWLMDLILKKHEEYIERFKMEKTEIWNINIKTLK